MTDQLIRRAWELFVPCCPRTWLGRELSLPGHRRSVPKLLPLRLSTSIQIIVVCLPHDKGCVGDSKGSGINSNGDKARYAESRKRLCGEQTLRAKAPTGLVRGSRVSTTVKNLTIFTPLLVCCDWKLLSISIRECSPACQMDVAVRDRSYSRWRRLYHHNLLHRTICRHGR